jgi:hypothetical protein
VEDEVNNGGGCNITGILIGQVGGEGKEEQHIYDILLILLMRMMMFR